MNLKNYFDKGLNYNDYLEKVNDQLETLEKTDKDSFLIPHYSLNLQRMKRLNKTFNLSDEQKNADRKSTRLNSSHVAISYAVFCLKKKKRHWTAFLCVTSSTGGLLTAEEFLMSR